MNRRLYIVDRSLRDARGHHLTLARTISRAALEAGWDVSWLTHRRFEHDLAPPGVVVADCFSESLYESFGVYDRADQWRLQLAIVKRLITAPPRRVYDSVRARLGFPPRDSETRSARTTGSRLSGELLQGLVAASESDHVLIHTCDGDLYRAVLDGLLKRRAATLPRFHLVTPYDPDTMPHYARSLDVDRVVDYYQALGVLRDRVQLYAETEPLAEYYRKRWNTAVSPLPVPPPVIADSAMQKDRDAVRVAYLGAARAEKGFALLPAVIERVQAQLSDDHHAVEFVIQANAPIAGLEANVEAALKQLRRAAGGVTLIERNQSVADYYSALARSDVVWLYYDVSKYRYRGSGIAAEAVSASTLVLLPPGLSVVNDIGDAALPVDDVEGIVEAILQVAADHEAFRKRAERCRTAFLSKRSGARYVEQLLVPNEEAPQVATDTDTQVYSGPYLTDWRLELDNLMGRANVTTNVPRPTAVQLLQRPLDGDLAGRESA